MDCPLCTRAEETRRERLARLLDGILFRPSPAAQMISAYGKSMAAMLGSPERSWYERHRDEWIRSGDDRELTRMLRHVG